jgi:hypothetical protein
VLTPVQLGQRTSKKGDTYNTGDILVHVKGGDGGPVQVDGRYELNGLSYNILDFFRKLGEGDTFVFMVTFENGYKRLNGLTTTDDMKALMDAFAE